jgi:hypothetical protein
MLQLIEKLKRTNRKLAKLKNFINRRASLQLQTEYHKLYNERKLILKHIALELY